MKRRGFLFPKTLIRTKVNLTKFSVVEEVIDNWLYLCDGEVLVEERCRESCVSFSRGSCQVCPSITQHHKTVEVSRVCRRMDGLEILNTIMSQKSGIIFWIQKEHLIASIVSSCGVKRSMICQL